MHGHGFSISAHLPALQIAVPLLSAVLCVVIRKARAAWLRSQLKGARSRHALINRQLMDARAAMDEARSALQSTYDAIQQLKAQFPRRFANL